MKIKFKNKIKKTWDFFRKILDKIRKYILKKIGKVCEYAHKVWSKTKKYILFLIFSGIGTGIDWLLMKTLAPVITQHLSEILIISGVLSKNVFQILAPIVCNIKENIYVITNFVSYPIGVAIAFILSAKYAFKTKKEDMNKCIRDTIVVHATGYALQEVLLFILTVYLGKDEDSAKFTTIVVNGILMLFSNIVIVFRERDNTKPKIVTIVKFLPKIKIKKNKRQRKSRRRYPRKQKKISET